MNKLTDEQIKQKLAEGRNYKCLYFELKAKYDELKAEHKQLEQDNQQLQTMVDTLKIQIAELQTMVFGKQRQPPTGRHVPELPKPAGEPRTKDSYRRPLPPATAITAS